MRRVAVGLTLVVTLHGATAATAAPAGPGDVDRRPGRARGRGQRAGLSEPPAMAGAEDALTSARQTREGELIVAEGFVDLRYQGQTLQADRLVLDERTNDLVADGNVVLQRGDQRLLGERLEYNLDTHLGRMWNAWGYDDPDVFFSAREVSKTGDDRFELRSPVITSCDQPLPQWRLRASSGTYVRERYIRLWNARLEIFGLPLIYLPFFQYPAKAERSTGFLFPAVGDNSQRGFYVGNSFFWAIGRSYDATVTHEWFSQGSTRVISEFRYVPSEDTRGVLQTQHLRRQEDGQISAQYRLTHNQRIGREWRAGATIDYSTDPEIDRDYSRSLSRISQRRRQSTAFVERNWSRYSLRLKGDHLTSFRGDDESVQSRLPEAGFGIRDTRVAGQLYAGLGAQAVYFGQQPTGGDTSHWSRFDFDPRLSMPMQPFPWLELRPSGSYRFTYWSNSFEPGTGRQVPTDDGYLRSFGSFNLRMVGPTVNRIFHTPDNGYSEKYKHVVQPELTYAYASAADEEGQSQRIDSVDSAGSSTQHRVNFTLRNRLLAKRSFSPNSPPTPHELLLFELTSSYDLERETDKLAPLTGYVKLAWNQQFSANYRFTYELEDGVFSRHSGQANWSGRGLYSDLQYSRSASVAGVSSEEVRSRAGFNLANGRIQIGSGVTYDINGRDLRDLSTEVVLRTQCCGFGTGYRRLKLGTRDNSELRFSISLKNIGTVFDYTLGEDAY